ncbi:MAG: FAD-dependent oxidoreductase, partial [Spirochaetia bacterium]|nr:FAD-dependent oxidoreductase [Spirochaetia bacterium]
MQKQSILRFILVFFVILSLCFFVIGGVLVSQSKKNTEGAYAFVIGISQANQRDPWRLVLSKELETEAAKHDEIKLIFSDAADDVEKQKADIRRLLAYDVDLLIVSPCNAVALTQTVREAYRSVPIIVLDRVVDGYDYSLFIGPENRLIGRQAGKAVLALAKNGPVKVLEVSASSSSLVSQDRHAGFLEEIGQAPNVSLASIHVEDGKRILIVVGESHFTGRGDPDMKKHYNNLVEFAEGIAGVEEVLAKWSAQDYKTPDQIPYIGRVSDHSNLYVATGFGKWGLSNGTLAGNMISELITTGNCSYESLYSRTRRDFLSSPGKAIQENFSSVMELIKS